MLQKKLSQKSSRYKCLETVSIGECVFAKTRSELKYNLMLWKEVVKKINVNISLEKTKTMILSGEESIEMKVKGIKLEQVKSFKHLGVHNIFKITENKKLK